MTKTMASVIVTGLMLAPMAAFGDSSSTDWNLGVGGLYSWSGGSSDLIGTKIPVLSVLGDSTPLKNGKTLSIYDGLLSFTTGAFNGTSSTGTGSLSITGCIAGVTAKTCTGKNDVTLVSDDFQSVKLVPTGGSTDALFGSITGTINASVASYFGLPTTFAIGSFSTTIGAIGSSSGFLGTNLRGGVLKADPPTRVPENWGFVDSIAFFAIVLLVFAAISRRGSPRSHFLQPASRS